MIACQTDKYKNSAHAQERHPIKPLTAQEILIAMGNSLDDYRTGVALYYEKINKKIKERKCSKKNFGVQWFCCFTRKHFYLQF